MGERMVKQDELDLEKALRAERPKPTIAGPTTKEIADRLGMHVNRLYYILEKWSDNGKWEYGVSLQTGWFV